MRIKLQLTYIVRVKVRDNLKYAISPSPAFAGAPSRSEPLRTPPCAVETSSHSKRMPLIASAFLAEKTRTPLRNFLWRCFSIDVSFPKPPSEREGDRDSGGRSLRDFGVLISFIVTSSPSVARGKPPAPAPSRREPLYVIPLRIVGSGFCPMVRGLPRAMLAADECVGKYRNPT